MKPIKGLLIVLLALAVVFTFGAPALAAFGSQAGSDEGGITVYPNAPGTKYAGPLTIYYTPTGDGLYDLHFFMRLRKGSNLYAFSGIAEDIAGDIDDIQTAIEIFFNESVMPKLYSQPYPIALVKSVDQNADDATSECCEGMMYDIMDVTIAVQD